MCAHCYCDILLSRMENGALNGAPPKNAHPYVVCKEPFCSHKTVVPNLFYLVHLLTPKNYFVHPGPMPGSRSNVHITSKIILLKMLNIQF